MSAKSFLDTNIFVYAFDTVAVAKSRIANFLIQQALTSGLGVISFQVAQEFPHLATRRFTPAMSVAEAESYLDRVLAPLLAVHSSKHLYLEALHRQARYRFSWYDSLIVSAALHSNFKVLLTDNLQHGQKIGSLRVENPFR